MLNSCNNFHNAVYYAKCIIISFLFDLTRHFHSWSWRMEDEQRQVCSRQIQHLLAKLGLEHRSQSKSWATGPHCRNVFGIRWKLTKWPNTKHTWVDPFERKRERELYHYWQWSGIAFLSTPSLCWEILYPLNECRNLHQREESLKMGQNHSREILFPRCSGTVVATLAQTTISIL